VRPEGALASVVDSRILGEFMSFRGHNARRFVAVSALASLALVAAFAQSETGDATAQSNEFRLDEVKQRSIWDGEHVTFKIETHVGKPMRKALVAGELEKVAAHFRDGATGAVPTGSGDKREKGTLTEVRRRAGSVELRKVDARGIARYLGDLFAKFSEVRASRLKVLQIERSQADPDLWTTRLLLDALGTAKGGGPMELITEHTVRFRFADPEEIRADNGVISSFEVQSEVVRSSKHALMDEVTEATGLADLDIPDNWKLEPQETREFRHQLAVEDFDRDGYLDIAIASIEGRPMLLRSVPVDDPEPGTFSRRFEDVTASVGIKPPKAGGKRLVRYAMAAWVDIDADGWPDLMLDERVFRNVKGRRFVDATLRSGMSIDRYPLGATVADYDLDGDLDVYVSYLKTFGVAPSPGVRPWVGDKGSGGPNVLWSNEGGGRFKDVTLKANAGGGPKQTFASAFFHFDDDRYPDLYVANDFGENVLLRNKGDGTFEEITEGLGLGDYATSMGVSTGDLDNDGTNEIYVANMFSKMGRRIIRQVDDADYPPGVYPQIQGSCGGNRLYRRSGSGPVFEEISEDSGVNQVGWAYAPAMADLDGDGLLDLYATTGFMSYDRTKPDG
jgi:hypothetical protein